MNALPSSGLDPAPAHGQVAAAPRRMRGDRMSLGAQISLRFAPIWSKARGRTSEPLPAAPPAGAENSHWIVAAGLCLLVAGFLRLLGAQGELCLDEIWTLNLLAPIDSVQGVLFDISHDNNHFMTSLYLYAVGLDAAPLLQRGLSILLGTATVAIAGIVASRNGRAAALAAMLLFAISYPLVHYGSEARGYSGWIFFSLLALACLQRQLERDDWGSRICMAFAVGLGFLAHLDMALTSLALGTWCLWVLWQRSGSFLKATVTSLWIFMPAMLAAGLVMACWVIGWERHDVTLGGKFPFSIAGFIEGYGGLFRWLAGVPVALSPWIFLASAIAAFLIACRFWRGRADHATSLYFVGILFLPGLLLAARLPNTEFPRHFLFCGAIFLLFLADLFGRAWERGGVRRSLAAGILAALVVGNLICCSLFFAYGRGHYVEAVAEMGRSGPIRYTGTEEFRTSMLVEFFSRRAGLDARYVKPQDRCRTPPDWLLVENPAPPPPRESTLGAPDCALRFVQQDRFPAWGLSGATWVLFRRVP
jgi:hypothetical protein